MPPPAGGGGARSGGSKGGGGAAAVDDSGTGADDDEYEMKEFIRLSKGNDVPPYTFDAPTTSARTPASATAKLISIARTFMLLAFF